MKLRVYNKTLDPNIWNEDKTIKPDVREHLLKVAEDFYNSTDLQGEIHDILFLGSSANYNWTSTSDVDIHVVIDIAEERINEEYARKFMDSLGAKWNTDHDIEVKGHPVEVYIQDVREPNSNASLSRPGAAIYSLFDGRWVQEPTHEKLNIDADKIRRKFQTIQAKVKKLVETNDIETLKDLMKSIKNYRNTGLANGGEFSTENLVFKALRKSGVLGTIKDTINSIYDKQVSLPEHGNFQPDSGTTPMSETIDKHAKLYLGLIKRDNFKVVATPLYQENGDEEYTHEHFQRDLGSEWRNLHDAEIIRWRYKPSTNTVYWWMSWVHPNEDEKKEVEHWLKDNLGARNVKHQWISGVDPALRQHKYDAHSIDESQENYLVVGWINHDLEIIAEKDTIGGENVTHEKLLKSHPEYDKGHSLYSIRQWRYKSVNNTVYWYEDDITGKQKFTVNEYLKEKFSVLDPKHINTRDLSGHKIDEKV